MVNVGEPQVPPALEKTSAKVTGGHSAPEKKSTEPAAPHNREPLKPQAVTSALANTQANSDASEPQATPASAKTAEVANHPLAKTAASTAKPAAQHQGEPAAQQTETSALENTQANSDVSAPQAPPALGETPEVHHLLKVRPTACGQWAGGAHKVMCP